MRNIHAEPGSGKEGWPDTWRHSTGGRAGLALLGIAFLIATCIQLQGVLLRQWHKDYRCVPLHVGPSYFGVCHRPGRQSDSGMYGLWYQASTPSQAADHTRCGRLLELMLGAIGHTCRLSNKLGNRVASAILVCNSSPYH